jgi:hypothetical protein
LTGDRDRHTNLATRISIIFSRNRCNHIRGVDESEIMILILEYIHQITARGHARPAAALILVGFFARKDPQS